MPEVWDHVPFHPGRAPVVFVDVPDSESDLKASYQLKNVRKSLTSDVDSVSTCGVNFGFFLALFARRLHTFGTKHFRGARRREARAAPSQESPGRIHRFT